MNDRGPSRGHPVHRFDFDIYPCQVRRREYEVDPPRGDVQHRLVFILNSSVVQITPEQIFAVTTDSLQAFVCGHFGRVNVLFKPSTRAASSICSGSANRASTSAIALAASATINLLLRHGVRTCLEYEKSGNLETARGASNSAMSPQLKFVDMGAMVTP